MNCEDLRTRLDAATPDVPVDFDAAMRRTLAGIVAEESAMPFSRPRRMTRRLALVLVLITLLLASAAVAAIHFNIFDAIYGKTPLNASKVMQGNLYQTTVNNVEITVKEAGYDGRTLYLMYSYRMLDVDTPLGEYRDDGDGSDGAYITEEDSRLLYDHNVGWWVDHIWFDGMCMDMPNNSGGRTGGSPTPGEIVEYQYWRLDNENVALNGEVEISLPIGERQSLEDYRRQEHPEKFDDQGNMLLPEKGIITFKLDTSDMRDKVTETHPNIEADLPQLTAKVVDASYTPIMMYVTLELNVKQEAMDAFIAENGDGYYNEEGVLLWPYGGMDVFDRWIYSLTLVDAQGNEVFPNMREEHGYIYGNNGYGDHWAEFLFPYAESYPEEMWLAPMDENGKGDISLGVRVK